MKKLIDSVNEDWRKTLASGALATSLALGGANVSQADTNSSSTRAGSHSSSHHKTLGQQNNNPLNIKGSHEHWHGQIGVDKFGHIKFDSLKNGFRAGVKNFLTNRRRNPDMSIHDYLRKFATASGSTIDNYAAFVLKKCGVSSDELNFADDPARIGSLDPIAVAAAQAQFESKTVIPSIIQDEVRSELNL